MTKSAQEKLPLFGTVALVTGSARGIGRRIVERLAEGGADVAIHYRNSQSDGARVAEGIRQMGRRAELFRADLTQIHQVRTMAREIRDTFGRVDHLVNNVGPFITTPFIKLPEADWDTVLNANLKAAWILSTELSACLRVSGKGHIINIAANSAFIHTHSIYGLAKDALIHLTESMAVELGPSVTVNAIAPGLVEGTEPDEELVRQVVNRTPLNRLVTADQIAEMCALLCYSNAFSTVTGRTIVMDGGRWLR